MLATVRTVADLRARVAEWRRAGDPVGLVPTMGALHEGHLSLVGHARRSSRRIVASLFVNPRQFGPGEDFARYPRDETADAAMLERAGADLLFAPSVAEMYPADAATTVTVERLTDGLCGPHRPGHFAGVATIVAKLLLQCLPDVAVFGEKDYQQLQVIRRMARDLDIPVRIEGAPTVRDEAGLALSSRNAYLTPDELRIARRLNVVLREVGDAARRIGPEAAAAKGRDDLLAAGFAPVDYVAVADAETLAPMARLDRPARAFGAAWIGRTRLIDNLPI